MTVVIEIFDWQSQSFVNAVESNCLPMKIFFLLFLQSYPHISSLYCIYLNIYQLKVKYRNLSQKFDFILKFKLINL